MNTQYIKLGNTAISKETFNYDKLYKLLTSEKKLNYSLEIENFVKDIHLNIYSKNKYFY